MRKKIVQIILTIMLGVLFSSGVAIIEASSSEKSIATDSNNRYNQAISGPNSDPPSPPPPPGGGGGG